MFYKFLRQIWRLFRGKHHDSSLDDVIKYMNNSK